jgi:hypothetical protein
MNKEEHEAYMREHYGEEIAREVPQGSTIEQWCVREILKLRTSSDPNKDHAQLRDARRVRRVIAEQAIAEQAIAVGVRRDEVEQIQRARDEERASIVRYLRWVAGTEVGTILSAHAREIVDACSYWVENRLDMSPSASAAQRGPASTET